MLFWCKLSTTRAMISSSYTCFLRSANSLNLREEVVDFLFCERCGTQVLPNGLQRHDGRSVYPIRGLFFSTYGLRRHDFIGFRVAHHTMLVNTRLMSKGVRTNVIGLFGGTTTPVKRLTSLETFVNCFVSMFT